MNNVIEQAMIEDILHPSATTVLKMLPPEIYVAAGVIVLAVFGLGWALGRWVRR